MNSHVLGVASNASERVMVRAPASIALAKTTIWGWKERDPVERLEEMKHSFQPHVTILFVRSPTDTLASLGKHRENHHLGHEGQPGYAIIKGTPTEKLEALEMLFRKRGLVDATIFYGSMFSSVGRNEIIRALRDLQVPCGPCKYVESLYPFPSPLSLIDKLILLTDITH